MRDAAMNSAYVLVNLPVQLLLNHAAYFLL